jgi:hypothetical protein
MGMLHLSAIPDAYISLGESDHECSNINEARKIMKRDVCYDKRGTHEKNLKDLILLTNTIVLGSALFQRTGSTT